MNGRDMFKQRINQQRVKKKPPPRPPPPNFKKTNSKPTWNLSYCDNVDNSAPLIDFSPPGSPKRTTEAQNFSGSVSSSFSSSSSSLASSKKSFEYELSSFNVAPWMNNSQSTFYIGQENNQANVSAPTIIRAQPPKKNAINRDISPISSLPMPSVPPPSPPKENLDIATPYGIALYDFPATQCGDLGIKENDVVILIRRISPDWYYGRVDNREGIFPSNFIDVKVPLIEDNDSSMVVALYDFHPQLPGDLELKTGQTVRVIRRASEFWLFGECNGKQGQFPVNFIDRVPNFV